MLILRGACIPLPNYRYAVIHVRANRMALDFWLACESYVQMISKTKCDYTQIMHQTKQMNESIGMHAIEIVLSVTIYCKNRPFPMSLEDNAFAYDNQFH